MPKHNGSGPKALPVFVGSITPDYPRLPPIANNLQQIDYSDESITIEIGREDLTWSPDVHYSKKVGHVVTARFVIKIKTRFTKMPIIYASLH
jgi:hypothetical protein